MGVTRYTIQIGNEEIKFEGPDGLTDAQIERLADQHLKTAKPGQKFSKSVFAGANEPESTEPAPERESGGLGAFMRGLPKDALFNFDDEIASFVNSVVPGLAELDNLTGAAGGEQQGPLDGGDFWARVKNNMGDSKAQRQADEQLNPVASALGRVGGVLSTLPRAAAGIGARLPEAVASRIAQRPVSAAIVAGTAGGAASGAGAGEEGTRAQSAALGGLAGAALGGGIVAGMELGPAIANYGKIFFNQGYTKEAERQMIKALARDGFDVTSPSGVKKLKDALGEFTGKPVSLADIGNATRSRTGVGLRAPSDAQQPAIDMIRNRQAGQGARIGSDVRATVSPRTDVHALDEQLVAQRASEAEKLREQALFEDEISQLMIGDYSPKQQENILRKYIGDVGEDMYAEQLNAAIRSGKLSAKDKEAMVRINTAIVNAPEHEASTVYRGVALSPSEIAALKRGQPLNKPSFNSASGDPSIVGAMADMAERDDLRSVVLNMRVPAGRNMRDVSDLRPQEWAGDDREFLLGPGKLDNIREASPTGGIPENGFEGYPTFEGDFIPSYGQVAKKSRVIHDPQLNWLARLPMAQKALDKALELAGAERDRLAIMGESIDHLPDLTKGGSLDMRSFDTLKRYLDQEVNRAFRGQSDTFTTAQASELKAIRDNLRERLREVNPEYGDYLDAYSGSSEMIDSLEQGRKFLDLDPEVIAAEQAKRSVAGQELYRTGAARNLLDTLKETKDTGNSASRILNSDESRDQLLATGVSPQDAARLNRSISQERTLNLLPQELAGSQTAQRAMSQADANAGADMAVPFNPGSPIGWLGMVGRTILDRTSVNRNAAVNEALLPQMLETNPAAVEGIIKGLEDQGNVAAAKLMRRRLLERRATLVGGSAIGAPVALPSQEGDY